MDVMNADETVAQAAARIALPKAKAGKVASKGNPDTAYLGTEQATEQALGGGEPVVEGGSHTD